MQKALSSLLAYVAMEEASVSNKSCEQECGPVCRSLFASDIPTGIRRIGVSIVFRVICVYMKLVRCYPNTQETALEHIFQVKRDTPSKSVSKRRPQ